MLTAGMQLSVTAALVASATRPVPPTRLPEMVLVVARLPASVEVSNLPCPSILSKD